MHGRYINRRRFIKTNVMTNIQNGWHFHSFSKYHSSSLGIVVDAPFSLRALYLFYFFSLIKTFFFVVKIQ